MTDMLTPTTFTPPRTISEIDGPLHCREIIQITHDVKSFVFDVPGGASLRFSAGQYLTFGFDLDGGPVERCYTISSAPTRPTQLTVTVKRVQGGPVSTYLHEQFQAGDTLTASGPHGLFRHDLHPAPRYLFLSAGSGITPSMSMLRSICDNAAPVDVAFLHCARTPEDIIFRTELAALGTFPNVTVTQVCEDDAPSEVWAGPRGRLSLPVLLRAVPDLLDREIFTCGPPPFMAAAREMLTALGVPQHRYHQESFDLGAAAAPRVGEAPAADAGDLDGPATETTQVRHRVEFRRSGCVVQCDSRTSLLTAAAQQGLTLPSSCGEGVCGTCKTGLLSGRVEMEHAGGIRPREVADGKILLCCSTPAEDLVIDA